MKTNYLCKTLQYSIFWLMSLTWGCIMTSIGLVVAVIMLLTGHKPHRIGPHVYFKFGKGWGGVELGPFFIVCEDCDMGIVYHEAGHGIQNIIWGPLMPFVICIPSAARYWYREYLVRSGKKRDSELPDYDAIWFEGQATRWGEKYYGV